MSIMASRSGGQVSSAAAPTGSSGRSAAITATTIVVFCLGIAVVLFPVGFVWSGVVGGAMPPSSCRSAAWTAQAERHLILLNEREVAFAPG